MQVRPPSRERWVDMSPATWSLRNPTNVSKHPSPLNDICQTSVLQGGNVRDIVWDEESAMHDLGGSYASSVLEYFSHSLQLGYINLRWSHLAGV